MYFINTYQNIFNFCIHPFRFNSYLRELREYKDGSKDSSFSMPSLLEFILYSWALQIFLIVLKMLFGIPFSFYITDFDYSINGGSSYLTFFILFSYPIFAYTFYLSLKLILLAYAQFFNWDRLGISQISRSVIIFLPLMSLFNPLLSFLSFFFLTIFLSIGIIFNLNGSLIQIFSLIIGIPIFFLLNIIIFMMTILFLLLALFLVSIPLLVFLI